MEIVLHTNWSLLNINKSLEGCPNQVVNIDLQSLLQLHPNGI